VELLKQEKAELLKIIGETQQQLEKIFSEKKNCETIAENEMKKNYALQLRIDPLEKKLAILENSLRKISYEYACDFERKNSEILRLETAVQKFVQEREILVEKLNSEDKFTEENFKVNLEYAREIKFKMENQVRNIGKLMEQKRKIVSKLSNEIKRNGQLIEKNSELKKILKEQYQILEKL